MRPARLIRRLMVSVLVLLLLTATGVALLNFLVVRAGRPYRVGSPVDAPQATVAIVLGAQVYSDGTCSPMLADRLRTAVALYRQGKVGRLLLSGDHGQVRYDEVNAMKDFALAQGVPPEDIFLDHAGFSTYETMYRARDVFQVTDALVVTQDFHLDRAVAIARALGLQATGVQAPYGGYSPARSLLAREWLARCKAWADLHVFHPLPTYLGDPIPITGDSRRSWD